MSTPLQFSLSASEIPKHWYNLLADFPEPLPPPLHPGTRQPVTPDVMTAIFPEKRASIALHHSAGYRTVGVRERIARHHGVWRDTVLLERRSRAVGAD